MSVTDHILIDESYGKLYEPEKGKFRLSNKRILLTYKTHLIKEEYKSWLKELVANENIIVEIAHETGTSKGIGYDHSHVLIDFGKLFTTTNCRKLDYKDIHPNIKKVTSNEHWENCLKYLAKEDPENAHLTEKKLSLVEAIWTKDNIQDAIKLCKKPNDALGIKTIFDLKKNEYRGTLKDLTEIWQVDLLNRLESTSGDLRKIIWYFDEKGGKGKSTLAKFAFISDPSKYHVIKTTGGIKDFSTNIVNAFDNGWKGHCIFFDLARACEAKQIWEPIEHVKDGMITSTKYCGKTIGFQAPHVVVMANFIPNVKSLSLDRWEIHELVFDENNEIVVKDLSIDYCIKAWKDKHEKSLLEVL